MKEHVDNKPTSIKVAVALFFVSFGTVLFTVILFRLLTFFIMPSLFFDLLFIGFPLGAILGLYFFKIDFLSFKRSLWILQGAMAFSVVAMLACKHFDYLRAYLYDLELMKLFGQILMFTLFFVPFFIAYGLSEYIGYQVGRKVLKGKMYAVYTLYLFGAALGYLFAEFFFRSLGVVPMMIIPFICVAIAMVVLQTNRIKVAIIQPTLLATVLFFPNLDQVFLNLYKGTSPFSTHYFQNLDYDTIHQKWGRYSLVEIMKAPGDENFFAGFYNDNFQWLYTPEAGFYQHGLGVLPLDILEEKSNVAIIGAGGGRQVQYALKKSDKVDKMLAIEIEPGVLEAVRQDLKDEFQGVYEDERVRLVNAEARGYMESTDEKFDLIYLPSVGGYPQMMLEPGNMIRTIDAFETLTDRLTDSGILAIWYPKNLDQKGILTEQYVRTLQTEDIAFDVVAYRSFNHVLIMGSKNPDRLPTVNEVNSYLVQYTPKNGELPHQLQGNRAKDVTFDWKADQFKPITDDQPFLAGNVQHIFSLEKVGQLFLLVAGLLSVFSVALILFLKKDGRSFVKGKSFASTVLISLIVGANFLIIEHYMILILFKKMYVYYNALVLGAISFLVVSGLGSTLISAKRRPIYQIAGCLFIIALLLTHSLLPWWGILILLLPVAFVTGSFFPALFEAASEKPIVVFAADAIGSALGLLVSFFVPIVFGFNVFFAIGTVIFLMTVIGTFYFFRNLKTH